MTIECEGSVIAAEPSCFAIVFILLGGLFPRAPLAAAPLLSLRVLAAFVIATFAPEAGHV